MRRLSPISFNKGLQFNASLPFSFWPAGDARSPVDPTLLMKFDSMKIDDQCGSPLPALESTVSAHMLKEVQNGVKAVADTGLSRRVHIHYN